MALTRREIMQRIRSFDTAPEVALRRALHAAGLRYRLGTRVAGMRPDIVLPSRNLVVFVDGCFWHGCPRHGRTPKTNLEFWLPKLAANAARDRRQTRLLRRLGWRVVRIWEHDITPLRPAALGRVLRAAGL